jgi:RimJ/RimL family protein N-acetyltransferase
MEYLTINASNIYLRPITYEDAEILFSYRCKPEVAKFQLWKPEKVNEATGFIKNAIFNGELINHQWNQFAICLRLNDKMVGDIGVLLNDTKAEIGFTIDPHFQRKGLAFESITSLIKYLFHEHVVRVIIAHTDPNNVPSITLLNKIGFNLDTSNVDASNEKKDLCFILNKDKAVNSHHTFDVRT